MATLTATGNKIGLKYIEKITSLEDSSDGSVSDVSDLHKAEVTGVGQDASESMINGNNELADGDTVAVKGKYDNLSEDDVFTANWSQIAYKITT